MMLPPTRRQDPRLVLELELASVRHQIRRLELLTGDPLAAFALELLAHALNQVSPFAELRHLWFAEQCLELALAWHEAGL